MSALGRVRNGKYKEFTAGVRSMVKKLRSLANFLQAPRLAD